MKKLAKLSKLRVSRETLRALHPERLDHILGGSGNTACVQLTGATDGGTNNSCAAGTCRAN